jgi:hypothetical protein
LFGPAPFCETATESEPWSPTNSARELILL